MATPARLQKPPDFSLVAGGPLYQLCRRAHLSGPGLELLGLRVLVISLLAWLPLPVLSAIEGHLFGTQNLSFVRDIESHARFVVALPVLLSAELVVHRSIKSAMKLFLHRGVVTPEDTPKFYAAIESASRARNSLAWEMALLVYVYTVGHWVWRNGVVLGTVSWYALPTETGLHLTVAGYWYSFVSIPIFQFILFRWYVRLVIWFLLLWRVSRLNLQLLPTHPDRAGGIGFLGKESSYAFGPILFAQGALLAGMIASRIFYQGQSLLSFKASVAGLVSLYVVGILGPLTMFTPHLIRSKRRGLEEYGTMATACVTDFDKKWIRGSTKGETILGTGDLESLANLSESYAVVREMKPVPFALEDVILLAVAAALPLLPLLLRMVPLEELVSRLIKIIF